MKKSFSGQVDLLKLISNKFDEESNELKIAGINAISINALPQTKTLISYFDVLLFLCAYPANEKILKLAENELLRIAKLLKRNKVGTNKIFNNSGLPYANSISKFSHDGVRWMLSLSNCKITLDNFNDPIFDLNEVLKLTLPSIERCETTAGLNNTELISKLLNKDQNTLVFLVNELRKFDNLPLVKDHLFDGLSVHINIIPLDRYFSRSFNCLPKTKIYFHDYLIKKFDHIDLLNKKLPFVSFKNNEVNNQVVATIKNAMFLTDRETDPTTFMDTNSLKLYELERGISVAIYGMVPNRQLPLESYVGFTLFKNGFPAAYGGSWIFGECALFGINIFETFRGGESGFLMCQLLRVFKQVFKVQYFEIEPYQYGLDNPDGIASGAFWFYYRFGFRPLDKTLLTIANAEARKINVNKNYRTSKRILTKFTESNIALNLGVINPIKVPEIFQKISHMIRTSYNGDRIFAEQECVKNFQIKTNNRAALNDNENAVLKEVSLWAEAFKVTQKDKLAILSKMIKTKPIDLYKYQQLVLQFFDKK